MVNQKVGWKFNIRLFSVTLKEQMCVSKIHCNVQY